jgi:hypothetical protein
MNNDEYLTRVSNAGNLLLIDNDITSNPNIGDIF